ncbi:sulfotransferase family protein [Lactiplantibacillus plajomi]|uniref:Sulfotransferase family protein n=1 Tax=Lactiplantibacillus plajomi TaxID=1457217 RepID=A0ABV6JZH0_9LACO|nr:sulfotransferase [Lactiplantibacillus plajomi]
MSQHFWQRLFNHRQQHAVLVLGSGRSGTSVMTKSLNLMGVSLGTDHLLAPSKRINPKGYFENKDVIKIHKSLGSKIRYRPATVGYYDQPQVKRDRQRLTTYLRGAFQKQDNLLIKDPRMNDYIQLWQHVLADIHVTPVEVILIRNPLDVVSSNERAWHRDNTLAMRQWQVRTLLSLKDTQPQSRILVTYEDLFGNTLATLKRIASQFDLPWPADEGQLQAQLDDFIDPSLQHSDHHESLAAFEARTDVAADVKALYLLARQAAADPEFFASTDFQQQIDRLLSDYLDRYGALYRDFNPKINGQTFFVFGADQTSVDQVSNTLAHAGVAMQEGTGTSHDVARDLAAQLEDRTIDPQTYTKDYQVLAQKERLNNFLRKQAKQQDRWGIGDVANTEIPEMLMAVSTELGLTTNNVVIVDDLTTGTPAEQRLRVQRLVRTLAALRGHAVTVVPAETLAASATIDQLKAIGQQRPAVVTASDQDDETALSEPVDWTALAQDLTELCQRASRDATALAQLNQFVTTNQHVILEQKGDLYANSVRN